MKFKGSLFITTLNYLSISISSVSIAHAQTPLKLNAINQHYLEYQGKPVIMITSAEHYGCLINPDFDYKAYLDALHEQGMNNTRIFSGTMVERKNDIGWMQSRNTLAPGPGKLLAPWARSNVGGYLGGGNKFDLDQWDEKYFSRLKDLLNYAASKAVFVELTLFGNQYKDSLWMNSPLYPDNNIQGEGPSGTNSFLFFQTMKNKDLLARQEAFVKKIITELNGYDNLYYEICNEPHNEVLDTVAVEKWHAHIVDLIKETEAALPKKHLIASNESIPDNPDISISNWHYVKVKNMPEFDWLYDLNKVISMDETTGSLIHSGINDVRVEAWNHILRGGAVYDNLSWEYTVVTPKGTDSAKIIRTQLSHLQKFMSTFDYLKTSPDNHALVKQPDSCFVRILSEKGKQYAVYIHHSIQKGTSFIVTYAAIDKKFRDTLILDLPKGNFDLQFFNPSTGSFIGTKKTIKQKTPGSLEINTPEFATDIAILILGKG